MNYDISHLNEILESITLMSYL